MSEWGRLQEALRDIGVDEPSTIDAIIATIVNLRDHFPGLLGQTDAYERGRSDVRALPDPENLYPHRGGWRHAVWCDWERGSADCSCGLNEARRSIVNPKEVDGARLRKTLERIDAKIARYAEQEIADAERKEWSLADRWHYLAAGNADAVESIRTALTGGSE